MKPIGFFVTESCEDYEQVLVLVTRDRYPPGGLLEWALSGQSRTLFATKIAARSAIDRTEHYRLAFGDTEIFPEKRFCKVLPVVTQEVAG